MYRIAGKFGEFGKFSMICQTILLLNLSIRQTFPRQTLITVNSPNFSAAKFSHSTVYIAMYCISDRKHTYLSKILFLLAGRHCAHEETAGSESVALDCDSTLQDYLDSLNVSCVGDDSDVAILTWTPDENTPDVVYYQVRTLFEFLNYIHAYKYMYIYNKFELICLYSHSN